jgi:hypothetical protein
MIPYKKDLLSLVRFGQAVVITKDDGPVKVFTGEKGKTKESSIGTMDYPFLNRISTTWRISSVDTSKVESRFYVFKTLGVHTFAWIKDSSVVFLDMSVDGKHLSESEFLALSNITTRPSHIFKTAKRLSRLFNAYQVGQAGFIPNVRIYENEFLDESAWDGAGIVSRRFVVSFFKSQGMTAKNIAKNLMFKRLEFTINNEDGQYKGHVFVDNEIVIDGEEYDFCFGPNAPKLEVSLSGDVFVGMRPVKGHDHMFLDIQSLVNLHEFFGVERLLGYLKDSCDDYLASIEDNTVLGGLSNIDDESEWLLAKYAQNKGKSMWFKSIVSQLGNVFLKTLSEKTRKNMRLPVPGGRYYIIADEVVGIDVKPGFTKIDPDKSAIIVNTNDYKTYIQGVLGGCDADDGCWIVPFTNEGDELGKKNLLVWRSPNQRGEYIILEEDGTFFEKYPTMDSSLLPERIDRQVRVLEDLPESESKSAQIYAQITMLEAIEAMIQNSGNLGSCVNGDTVYIATLEELSCLLHPLEQIIDSTVKDGRDTSPAILHVRKVVRQLFLESRTPVSIHMVERLSFAISEKERQNLVICRTSWLDHLITGVDSYIEIFKSRLEELSLKAMPPSSLFQAERDEIAGQELVSLYGNLVRESNEEPDWDSISQKLVEFLGKCTNPKQCLMGAASIIYTRQDQPKDSVLWLAKSTSEIFMEALTESGIFGEENNTATRVVIGNMWYSMLKAKGEQRDIFSISDDSRRKAEKDLDVMSRKLSGIEFILRREEINKHSRLVAYSTKGVEMGVVPPRSHESLQGMVGKTMKITSIVPSRGDAYVMSM